MIKKAKQILQKADIEKLPSLPHVLLQLFEACESKTQSFRELASILKYDAGLYARVIAEHARNQAVVVPFESEDVFENILQSLGISTIQNIVTTAAVQQYFSDTDTERLEYLKQHWMHSLDCAITAEAIARESNYSNPNEAYIAGLLHDIGQLVLVTAYADKYSNILSRLAEDENLSVLENNEFGTTHQQVGAELLREHGINHFVCDAVLYHHESIDNILDVHPLVKIIYLANTITMDDTEEQVIFDAAERLLGLEGTQLRQVIEKSRQRARGIGRRFGIALPSGEMDGKTREQQFAGDDVKQAELAEQIRNIALLDGIHQHMSRNIGEGGRRDALVNTILQNIAILFGVEQCIVFLYDAASDRVNAIAAENQPSQLADITIPLTSGRSLITDALLTQEVCHSFHTESFEHNLKKKISIVDQQLIGIMRHEGIICLPMIMNNVAIGTLALGVNQIQYNHLSKQLPFLTRFANEVGRIISYNKLSGSAAVDNRQYKSQLEQKIHEVLHEVRNPLSIMNNYLGILSYKLENDKPAQEDIRTIKSEIERVGQILRRLTEEEGASDAGKTTLVDINAIITDLTRVFQTSLFASKNIQISLDLDERINALPSNANAIKQIYTNLIKNAVEALDANGEIMVYTQDYVNVDGEEHIEISVADNGPGIDVDILPRLFSPIQTTKGGSHAGLGLTIVKNLVNELHGSISCRSSDKGTGFYILLPKQPKKVIKSGTSRDHAEN